MYLKPHGGRAVKITVTAATERGLRMCRRGSKDLTCLFDRWGNPTHKGGCHLHFHRRKWRPWEWDRWPKSDSSKPERTNRTHWDTSWPEVSSKPVLALVSQEDKQRGSCLLGKKQNKTKCGTKLNLEEPNQVRTSPLTSPAAKSGQKTGFSPNETRDKGQQGLRGGGSPTPEAGGLGP